MDGDERFMNEDMRDFLNTKEDGCNYTISDMKKTGWKRLYFPGDNEHQHNQNGGRNKKFINNDGREVVFDANGIFIGDGLDRGTYNYAVPKGLGKLTAWGAGSSHGRYDMKPFFRQNHIQPLYWRLRVGSNYGFNSRQ